MNKAVYEYISKQTGDPIVEWKTCAVSSEPFAIFQSDLDFYDKISPSFNYPSNSPKIGENSPSILEGVGGSKRKHKIPIPTLSPEERQRRRLMFRNERKLYKRKCDLCNKNIVSIYSLDKPYKAYCYGCWWGDKWDASKYAQEIDLNRSFFEQFNNLLLSVPLLSSISLHAENSEYTNYGYQNKDCYMTFASDFNEKCCNSNYLWDSNKVFDCFNVRNATNSYNLVDSNDCHKCFYSQRLNQCSDCFLSYALVNCTNCFGSCNLQGQSYSFFNKQFTKEEYEKEVFNRFKANKLSFMELEKIKKDALSQARNIVGSENSEGDGIKNSKNCYFCFDVNELEDCKYCTNSPQDVQDCYDFDGVGIISLSYEGISVGGKGSHHNLFCSHVWDGSYNVLYSLLLFGCSNCFGCIGLKNKQYCIFNKQYSKEEYEKEVGKVIEHMQSSTSSPSQSGQADGQKERGEFFDSSLSPFGYNETVAQEYYPLTKEEALARGYKWMNKGYPINVPDGMKTVEASELDIPLIRGKGELYNDSILNKAILCEETNKPFRIVKLELEFYKKHNLPLPRKHPDARHIERMKQRPGRELYLRKCYKCGKEMLSVYKKSDLQSFGFQESSEEVRNIGKVYCETCYKQEIYG